MLDWLDQMTRAERKVWLRDMGENFALISAAKSASLLQSQ